jgi:hypothetical protein
MPFLVILFLLNTFFNAINAEELNVNFLNDLNVNEIKNLGSPPAPCCIFPEEKNINEKPCEELKTLSDEYDRVSEIGKKLPFDEVVKAKLQKLRETGDEQTQSCLNSRFASCYQNLKESFELKDLEAQFKEFTQDPRLRYKTAGSSCYTRAMTLLNILGKKGYAAKNLQIVKSPSLIGFDLDTNNKLKGSFYQYHNNHSLVEVMVKVEGQLVPYLLDPQFMTRPMPRDEYFKRVTGQICKEKVSGVSDCKFIIYPQNYLSQTNFNYKEILNLNNPNTACGWSYTGYEIPEGLPSLEKTDGLMQNMQAAEYLSVFNGRSVSEDSYKKLTIYSYEHKLNLIKEKIKESEQIILDNINNSSFKRDDLKTYELKIQKLKVDLAEFINKVEIVKKNLDSLR